MRNSEPKMTSWNTQIPDSQNDEIKNSHCVKLLSVCDLPFSESVYYNHLWTINKYNFIASSWGGGQLEMCVYVYACVEGDLGCYLNWQVSRIG